jgi:hypothetical protein
MQQQTYEERKRYLERLAATKEGCNEIAMLYIIAAKGTTPEIGAFVRQDIIPELLAMEFPSSAKAPASGG